MKDVKETLGEASWGLSYPLTKDERLKEGLNSVQAVERALAYHALKLGQGGEQGATEYLEDKLTKYVDLTRRDPAFQRGIETLRSRAKVMDEHAAYIKKTLESATEVYRTIPPPSAKRPPIVEVKRSFKAALAYNLEHDPALITMVDSLTKAWGSAAWFDFRDVNTHDPSMSEFGSELIGKGIVELPYPTCAFVYSFLGKGNIPFTLALLLKQEVRMISSMCTLLVPENGRAFLMWSNESPTVDNPVTVAPVAFGIAALSARGVRKEVRTVSGDKDIASYPPEKAAQLSANLKEVYRKVVIDYSKVPGYGHGEPRGEGAPRKLHWRRGHVRHYSNREDSKVNYTKEQTWVRAALVGIGSDSIILHDYEYRQNT